MRIEILQLLLSDFAELILGKCTDLDLVRDRGTGWDTKNLLDQIRCRWGFGFPDEGAVIINGDNNRNDRTCHAGSLFVVSLDEFHHVDTVATKSWSNRRRRSCFTCVEGEFDHADYFFSHAILSIRRNSG